MAHPEAQASPVTALVPAYNEVARVSNVLTVLTTYPGFKEVIVIDDGSTDATAAVARRFPARVIRLPKNMGKGQAMDHGVQAATTPILFFCDADVKGLTHSVIEQTLAPVLTGDVDMMIAMRNRKIYYARFILRMIPLLGGERALTRSLWEQVPATYKQRFRIEAALNFYAHHGGRGFGYRVFPGLTQTIKEKKYGWWPGFTSRLRMFYEVMAAELSVHMD